MYAEVVCEKLFRNLHGRQSISGYPELRHLAETINI